MRTKYKNLDEVLQKFAEFYYGKHGKDTEKAITSLGITDCLYLRDQDLFVITVSRPGFLIGKKGENIDDLSGFLDINISIQEAKETITDKILHMVYQCDPSYYYEGDLFQSYPDWE
jgi:hypothetical protein